MDLMYSIELKQEWPLSVFDMVYSSNRVCVAGSAAIHKLAQFLEVKLNWEPADIDIFFLDSPQMGRSRANDRDIIASTFKSIEELLNSFDLPCSRVAYDDHHIFFTRQAINAILHGEYWLASMIMDAKSYCKALVEISRAHVRREFFDKTQKRIAKYSERGMKPRFFETNTVPHFLSVRKAYSHYAGEPVINTRPTLLMRLNDSPISRQTLYSAAKANMDDFIVRLKFGYELRDHLKFVLSPRYPILQETMAVHTDTLKNMKEMLNKPIRDEREFKEAMTAQIVKLERLFMAQKI